MITERCIPATIIWSVKTVLRNEPLKPNRIIAFENGVPAQFIFVIGSRHGLVNVRLRGSDLRTLKGWP